MTERPSASAALAGTVPLHNHDIIAVASATVREAVAKHLGTGDPIFYGGS